MQKGPKRGQGIRRKTLSTFLIAFSLPLFFLLRVGYDNFIQAQDLQERESIALQSDAVHRLDEIYQEFENTLKKIGVDFYKQRSLKKFSGYDDPGLWTNTNIRFFEFAAKKEGILQRYQINYSKFRILFKKHVLEKLLTDPSSFDPTSSPIKIQIYVLEKSIFDPQYSTNEKYKPRLVDGKINISTLFPDGLPSEQISKYDADRFLDSYPYTDWFHHLPTHAVLHPNNDILNLFWDNAIQILRPVIRTYTFGPGLGLNFGLKDYTSGIRANLMDYRDKFLPLNFMGYEVETYWNVFPHNFDYSRYLEGDLEAPRAYYLFLLDKVRARQAFLNRIEDGQWTSSFSRVEKMLQDFRSWILHNKLGIQGILLGSSKKIHQGEEPKYHNFLKFIPSDYTQARFKNEEELEKLTLVEQLGKTRDRDISILGELFQKEYPKLEWNEDAKNLTLLARKWQKPVSASLMNLDQKIMFGSVVPSRKIEDLFFLVTQDPQDYYERIQKNGWLILCLALLCLIIAISIAIFLSKTILEPIEQMQSVLSSMAIGNYSQRLDLQRKDELGLLGNSFDRTAIDLETRLKALQTISGLYQAFNLGDKFQLILEQVLSDLTDLVQAQSGAIAISEGSSTPRNDSWIRNGHLDDQALSDSVALMKEEIQWSEVNDSANIYWKSSQELPEGSVHIFLVLVDCKNQDVLDLVSFFLGQLLTLITKNYFNSIHEEVHKGRELQLSLMPQKELQDTASYLLKSYYVPSRGLAGDFYDFRQIDDELHLLVADVAGKGIGAGLYGACARSYLRYFQTSGINPSQILSRVNMSLLDKGSSSLFITVFYAIYNPQKQEIRYASAGHNQMLLRRADSTIEELNGKGIPLGMFEQASYSLETVKFYGGDSLLLYTDGISECESPDLELFGIERVKNWLAQEEEFENHFEKLIQRLDQHRQGGTPSDDMSMIYMRSSQ